MTTEDDSLYDYYLLIINSDGVIYLTENAEDAYGGSYSKGRTVLPGNFFLREILIDHSYKLNEKVAGVFPGTVRYICGPVL